MSKYDKLTKEELLKLIEKQEKELKSKKYGLVWDSEKEPEKVVLECENNIPILQRIKEKEVKTDDSENNILIEGDNYHALTVLNYTHKEKIDVIYIDPPYNTGKAKEWKYNDKYIDENDGYRHSKWLNFMEKRLKLAKQLLKKDGVIFISIDDNEVYQLKILCDSIFSEKNFVGSLIWEKKKKGSYLADAITNIKEYVLVYSANKDYFKGLIGEKATKKETYPCINPGNGLSVRTIRKGIISKYKEKNYTLKRGKIISAGNMSLKLLSDLVIIDATLQKDILIEAEWRYSQEALDKYASQGELYITNQLYFRRIVTKPRYKKLKDILSRVENEKLIELQQELILELKNSFDEIDSDKVKKVEAEIEKINNRPNYNTDFTNLYTDGWGSNEDGDNELRDFFGEKVFDNPKPSKLIAKLIASTHKKNAIILDFMAGTGTTGQAVAMLNKKIGGNRKFILCTNNENNICTDITYPRLQKVIKGYRKRSNGEFVEGLGGNLQYFKTDLIPVERIDRVSDKKRNELTEKAGQMIAIKENTFEEIELNEWYQIFESKDKKRKTAIYFREDKDKFETLIEKIKDYKTTLYIFSYGRIDKKLYKYLCKNITIDDIPEPILEIYKEINLALKEK